MNSSDCDRISARASALSSMAASPRLSISTCELAITVDQSKTGTSGLGSRQAWAAPVPMPAKRVGRPDWWSGRWFAQPVPAKSFRASQEYHSADQLRAGKCGRLMVGELADRSRAAPARWGRCRAR